MPKLRFLCPTTQKLYDSGIRVDGKTADATRLNIALLRCPECGREHRALVADGVLTSVEQEEMQAIGPA